MKYHKLLQLIFVVIGIPLGVTLAKYAFATTDGTEQNCQASVQQPSSTPSRLDITNHVDCSGTLFSQPSAGIQTDQIPSPSQTQNQNDEQNVDQIDGQNENQNQQNQDLNTENMSSSHILHTNEYYINPVNAANILGWIPTKNNVCRGYFGQPAMLSSYPHPLAMSELPSQISSSGPTLFSRTGPSVLLNDVIYSQPGRIATADKAIIYRNSETGRLELIHLSGNVRLLENGMSVAGPYGNLNLASGTANFGPAAYHIMESPNQFHHFTQTYNGWGQTHGMHRHPDGMIDLYHTTYTTCAPESHPPWQIFASHVRLDHDNAVGHAYNAVLKFKGVPVFYLPYYTFPLNSDRKSGFLTPTPAYSTNNGFGLRWPYYWNLAPNYDMLITPRLMSKRGLQVNDLIRYLTHRSYTELYGSFIPHDFAFASFRQDTLDNPPDTGHVNPTPFLNELESDSANRGFVSLLNDTHFSDNWTAHLVSNYVTDPYYFRDFGNVYGNALNDQLLNQADIGYGGNHWNLYTMIQGFQTLHLIDDAASSVRNQYTRLPEVDLNGNYPNFLAGLVAQLSAQSVNFVYHSDFNPVTDTMPIGERLHVMPSLSRPFNWTAGYITPQISLDSTSYEAQDAITGDETSRESVEASRNLPVANIDSGLYFQREWAHLGLNGYEQTLEPRLMYLYVPYQNQDQYPVFDTQILNFSYDQIFSLNRFSSFDRLENANQVSMGVTSRFLNSATTMPKLQVDFGTIYYISPPKVCLNSANCEATYNVIPSDADWSPIVSDISYNFLPGWTSSAGYAWNPETNSTDNGYLDLSFHKDPLHIIRFGYQFYATNGNSTDAYGLSNNTNNVYTGAGWPITEKLSALGYVFYNFSKERADQYYAGLQYDTCCWAIRTVMQRDWTGNSQNADGSIDNQYDTLYTVQLELKSLGNVGSGSSKTLINNTLPGFFNPFVN